MRLATAEHVENLFSHLEDVAEQISKVAFQENVSFPFITVSLFEALALHTRQSVGVESVYWGPIVEQSRQQQWVDYSVENFGWLEESRRYALAKQGRTREEAGYDNNPIRDFIFDIDENAAPLGELTNPSGPWEPLW